jgi:hypothetical protein
MTFKEFINSTHADVPPAGLHSSLIALWYDLKGNWDRAHDFADSEHNPENNWVHAYLHRVEGDDFNAGYWYRKAGKSFPRQSLEAEREAIIRELLH